MGNLLRHPCDKTWFPLIGATGWTQGKKHAAGTTVMKFRGAFLRCMIRFGELPLILGRLVRKDAPEAEQAEIAAACWRCRKCCASSFDGFSLKLLGLIARLSDVRAPWVLKLLEDTFCMMQPANVQNEDRFARARKHTEFNDNVTTFCSNHVLSEWSSSYNVAWQQSPPYCTLLHGKLKRNNQFPNSRFKEN